VSTELIKHSPLFWGIGARLNSPAGSSNNPGRNGFNARCSSRKNSAFVLPTSASAQFYSFGFGGRGLGSGCPHDRWGLGWYYMTTSRELPDFVHLGDEQGGDVFYNFADTPACMITADLQVTDSAKEGIGTAVIGGVRATLRF
jgi:hypothetical protein